MLEVLARLLVVPVGGPQLLVLGVDGVRLVLDDCNVTCCFFAGAAAGWRGSVLFARLAPGGAPHSAVRAYPLALALGLANAAIL